MRSRGDGHGAEPDVRPQNGHRDRRQLETPGVELVLLVAVRGLGSDDVRLRGTSLEYLENVLPDRVREGLWPYVGDKRSKAGPKRPRQAIIDDLLRSNSSLSVESMRNPGKQEDRG